MKKTVYLLVGILILFISSCSEENIEGCLDSTAINFNPEATVNNNSCLFDSDGDGIYDSDEIEGCTDNLACNFDINATDNDNLCEYPEPGVDCDGNEIQMGGIAFGGFVFYIDETGQHGLVAAMEDLTEGATDPNGLGFNGYEWGCHQESVYGADGQDLGTGYLNTNDIVNQGCTSYYGGITAAQAALDTEINGHNDWYLPSQGELFEMYHTIGNGSSEGNTGGFVESRYWSSSEYYINLMAWGVNFDNGISSSTSKNFFCRVRVIRAF